MAVLSRKKIYERLRMPVDDDKSLVVTPLLKEDAFDRESLDLRLGSNFLIPRTPPQPFVDPNSRRSFKSHMRVHVPLGSYVVVPAHETVLGTTLEFIKLPFDVSGQILTKSSVARTFTVIETAPWIHPSYRGCLTLEIANVSNTPILLYPGRPVGQLILLEVLQAQKTAKLSGSYLGPVFPEPPPESDVEQDLRSINIDDFRHPCDEMSKRR